MVLESLIKTLHPKNLAMQSIKAFANKTMGEAGSMTDLKVDLKKQSVELTLDLKGEKEPLHVVIFGFEIKENGEITFTSISTSKPWITALAESYFKNKTYVVPKEHKKLVSLLRTILT